MKPSLRMIAIGVLLIGCITSIVVWKIFVMRSGALMIANSNTKTMLNVTSDTESSVSQESEDTNQQIEPTSNTPSTLIYESKNYDFVLIFPASWEGYAVTELEGNEPGVVADAVLVFNALNVNEIFTIDVWKKTSEELPQAVIDSQKMMLGESNDYYFEYESISAAVLEDNGLTPAEIANIQTEIQQVVNSFSEKQ